MSRATLSEKRKQMLRFILDNTRGTHKELQDLDAVFRQGTDRYRITAVSRQMNLDEQYRFRKNPKNFDEDLRELRAVTAGLVALVQKNWRERREVTGFIFLRADTDYTNILRNEPTQTNRGHFAKQRLPDFQTPVQSPQRKRLDKLELAVQQLCVYNEIGETQFFEQTVPEFGKRVFKPGPLYFNTKKDQVEEHYFAALGNPRANNRDKCPVCVNPNGREYDHTPCKKSRVYQRWAIVRNEVRYDRVIQVARTRLSVNAEVEFVRQGLLFVPASLTNAPHLSLKPESGYLAVLKP